MSQTPTAHMKLGMKAPIELAEYPDKIVNTKACVSTAHIFVPRWLCVLAVLGANMTSTNLKSRHSLPKVVAPFAGNDLSWRGTPSIHENLMVRTSNAQPHHQRDTTDFLIFTLWGATVVACNLKCTNTANFFSACARSTLCF